MWWPQTISSRPSWVIRSSRAASSSRRTRSQSRISISDAIRATCRRPPAAVSFRLTRGRVTKRPLYEHSTLLHDQSRHGVGLRSGGLETAHGCLDPRLDLLVELTRLATCGRDRRTDDHAHGPPLLHHAAARPIEPGVVCHRHDEPAGLDGEQRAAHAVAARFARGHARALREDHDPVALVQPLLALLDDLSHRGMPGPAVEGDR